MIYDMYVCMFCYAIVPSFMREFFDNYATYSPVTGYSRSFSLLVDVCSSICQIGYFSCYL